MDSVIKAAIVYLGLWALVRLTGRRSLAQLTVFEFILFLIIGGAIERTLLAPDYSLTSALLVIATLVGIDILLSLITRDSTVMRSIFKGLPMILVENGRVLSGRVRHARLTEDAIMEAARLRYGLESITQVKFAILETNGEISIIPQGPPRDVREPPAREPRKKAAAARER